jgi:protein-S-isoprenylcysteine O-methyltransferase Ste14
MKQTSAAVASALFFLIAPGTIGGYFPWSITRWHVESTGTWSLPLKVCGALLLLTGIAILADSFVRFVVKGLGTPAPPLPTQHLVVSGLYRYVRNPMYVAVAWTIFGQALVFGNRTLLVYGAFVSLCFHLFVIAYEEPSLRTRFGNQYTDFCAAVPRWIPRIRPWQRETSDPKSDP